MIKLTKQQIETYHKDGFLVIPDVIDEKTCATLREEAMRLVRDWEPKDISIFSTKSQQETSDKYFLESGDKVRFFFEEHAFDDKGQLKQAKEKSINKIGHALHYKNDVFRQFSQREQWSDLVRQVGHVEPVCVQSMYILKNERIGGRVACHRDSTFLHTEPLSTVGVWMALEEATVKNGCLWALKGSHRTPLERRFVRVTDADGHIGVQFKPSPPPEDERDEHDVDAMVALEARPGTVVLLHGSTVHYSARNESDASRHAYTLHFVETRRGVKYSKDNWLQTEETSKLH